jgi:hypothetical protein
VRGRVWILIAIAALAVLSSSAPVFRDDFTESRAATFGDVLNKQFPGWSGFNTCLPTAVQGKLDCWAELHRDASYRIVESKDGTLRTQAEWTRAWHAVPAQTLRTFGAGGRAVANSTVFDWGLVAGGLLRADLPAGISSVSGDSSTRPPAIFTFTCRGRAIVSCANAVGDTLRYTR